ncbi:MAG: MdtA/MuxA family multidrug efflux RND transporter periplasmic adaptor subunit [Verrucomicrobia bacterium]|nr:MdtA/MuxA family multidrug efflux RND transporter periplasmic adaptor subunit [Verrucomicrobiota bacterium]
MTTTVGIAVAKKGNIQIFLNGLGTVTPPATVTIKPQVNGQLIHIAFTEGQQVRKGDFLAQIDPRPFQAVLDQQQGQLDKDRALLENARVDLARYERLKAQDSVARQTLDTQVALVHQYEGTVRSDQGQVENAQVNLNYCRILSPIDGVVGLRQVDEGNYVQTSDPSGLVVITQIDPITVIFTVTEDEISKVTERLRAGVVLPVTVYDRTNSTEITQGKLMSVDNQVDPATGTVKLRAAFDNRDRKLFPQQFVNAKLLVDTLQDAVVIPTAAIQLGAPGSYVYVVNADVTVSVRVIKPGPIDGERAAVLSGLEVGETVVNDGVDRLYDGAKVQLPDKHSPHDDAQRPHRFSGRPDGSPLPDGSPRWRRRGEHEHEHGNGNEQRRQAPDAP